MADGDPNPPEKARIIWPALLSNTLASITSNLPLMLAGIAIVMELSHVHECRHE